ncbi:OmpA family protein [Pseudomonadota bacterium]
MKRILLTFALLALLSVGVQPAAAQELGEAKDYDKQWKGMGVGALVGAIAGGPPGLIVGIASGGLIGRNQGLESDLEDAQQQIEVLAGVQSKMKSDLEKDQQEIIDLRQALVQSEPTQAGALAITKKQYAAQLDAIAQGFILNIQFRTESADLEPHFQQQLDRAIATLKAFPELSIHVNAYADKRGTAAFNKTLTQQRANGVVRHLRASGIPAHRIRELALGESQAAYPMQDAEGMDFDRRVLLYFYRG